MRDEAFADGPGETRSHGGRPLKPLSPETRALLASARAVHAFAKAGREIDARVSPYLDRIPFGKLALAGAAIKIGIYAVTLMGHSHQTVVSQSPVVVHEMAISPEVRSSPAPEGVILPAPRLPPINSGPTASPHDAGPQEFLRTLEHPAIALHLDRSVPSAEAAQKMIRASHRFGLKPELVLAMGWLESRFQPSASASLSSADGLFQFTDAEWLRTVAMYDRDVGWKTPALHGKVHIETDGRISVDPADRTLVLATRLDETVSAMAVAYNASQAILDVKPLRQNGKATAADVYIRHLLGSRGGARFFRMLEDTPDAPVSSAVSRVAIRNNAPLFEREGHERSIAESYNEIGAIMQSRMAFYRAFIASVPQTVVKAPKVHRDEPGHALHPRP